MSVADGPRAGRGGTVLALGKAGTAGAAKGVVPVVADGRLVATLQASNWKEQAVAVVGDRSWTYTRRKRELVARWSAEPEDAAVRLSARQASMWKGTWTVQLDATTVEVAVASMWKGTHRFTVDGRVVAESGMTGFWQTTPTLTADPALPLDHQVFLLWLVLVISRRNNSTVAATAAIGAAGAAGS